MTVTKIGGTHTKFNISPLSPTELKLEASARAAKRATTTFAAAAAEEEKILCRELERFAWNRRRKKSYAGKATEDRVKAEEEAAKEAIVEKRKRKRWTFSTNFLRRKRMKESITRTPGERPSLARAYLGKASCR